MPRPLKSVPADTLGGKIRAARQRLHLSLAEVAGKEYSTSLISQIERNKIEPSPGSLRYLAQRLNLPLNELAALSQQHRTGESDAIATQRFEELRLRATLLLENNQSKQALKALGQASFNQVSASLRWRLIALRGQCYFALRQFINAQKDFNTALNFLPEVLPQEQKLDAVLLRLHLAAASRELGQYVTANEQYTIARDLMDTLTPLRYVAEAHWGIALVLFEQAYKADNVIENVKHASDAEAADEHANEHSPEFYRIMEHALKHAETARSLYESTNEQLRASLLDCLIASIEQALHRLDAARERLRDVLNTWQPALTAFSENEIHPPVEVVEKIRRYNKQERANIVSAAAAYLANIELEAQQPEQAIAYVDLALSAGKHSYILRRADAYMIQGQILVQLKDSRAIEAFQNALDELSHTDRLGAQIRVHRMMGSYLISIGEHKKGEAELDTALQLANVPMQFNATAAEELNSFATHQE